MNPQLLHLFLEWNDTGTGSLPGSSWRSLWFSKQSLYFSPRYYMGTSKSHLWECGHMTRKQVVNRHGGTCLDLQHLGRDSLLWISLSKKRPLPSKKASCGLDLICQLIKVWSKLGVVVHAFDPSTWKAEVGGSLSSRLVWATKWAPFQDSQGYRETLFWKQTNKEQTKTRKKRSQLNEFKCNTLKMNHVKCRNTKNSTDRLFLLELKWANSRQIRLY